MALEIVKCQYDEDWDREISYKDGKAENLKKRWKVLTAGDDAASAAEVLQLCSVGPLPSGSDDLPNYGDPYVFGSYTDNFAYANKSTCKLVDPTDPNLWLIEIEWEAPGKKGGSGKEDRERLTKPNPLDWDPIYWKDWVEDQVPVERATLIGAGLFFDEDPMGDDVELLGDVFFKTYVKDFPLIKRGTNGDEPGALVNGAGQQTVDPITEAEFHPILIAKRNYLYGFISDQMNEDYDDCVNSEPFLGRPARTWKYLISYTDQPQEKEIEEEASDSTPSTRAIITYYPTYTKLEYNKRTWDIFLLNNGQSCFRFAPGASGPIMDPRDSTGDTPMLFPVTVAELKEDVATYHDSGDDYTVTLDDLEIALASEPVNLTPDGRPIHEMFEPSSPWFKKAVYMRYRKHKEVDFNTIPAFAELVAEYTAFAGS